MRRETEAGSVGAVQITQQLALFLDNRPGMLARVCDALSAAKINIFAISSSDTVDHIVIRMVVSDSRRALEIFEEHGTLVVTSDVLMIEGSNKPGALAEIAHKLAKAKINIEYAYCATSPKAQKGLLILRAADPKKALKVLNS
ncbi:MAG: ACT domain-containing protein [Verrucomicrobiota bacterium]|nr:ACT domain-containing protein [Verrucomicrobiota bacterium]